MDPEEGGRDSNEYEDFDDAQEEVQRPRELPADLPRSLDDRKNFRSYNEDIEYYDAWQGTSKARDVHYKMDIDRYKASHNFSTRLLSRNL